MVKSYFSINIPLELQQYTLAGEVFNDDIIAENVENLDFGVKLFKDSQGNMIYSAYYSDSGELLKKVFYKGPNVSHIEHYRNNSLSYVERFSDGKITKKVKYDVLNKISSIVTYIYNRKDKITSIKKSINNTNYEVNYDYDDLMRVNSRFIKVNNKPISSQHYKYDILDRIVEYHDDNQTIKVLKMNHNNELVSYNIIDKIGNFISILNKFMCSEYLCTDIDLNGHKTTVKNRCYVDNVMLKKPYTTEDDLDFAVSKLLQKNESTKEKPRIRCNRQNSDDILSFIINLNLNSQSSVLPISMRKILLLKSA